MGKNVVIFMDQLYADNAATEGEILMTIHGIHVPVTVVVGALIVLTLALTIVSVVLSRMLKALGVIRDEQNVVSAVEQTEETYRQQITDETAEIKRLSKLKQAAEKRRARAQGRLQGLRWARAVLRIFQREETEEDDSELAEAVA